MSHPKRAGAAFGNILRMAWRRPLWMLLYVVAVPFSIWRDLLGWLIVVVVITYLVGMGAPLR